uniref:Uncharacterized protein n=1 Tax=Arundo donax TaxID=35708 RepID=A0A0A9HF33_ARUDO
MPHELELLGPWLLLTARLLLGSITTSRYALMEVILRIELTTGITRVCCRYIARLVWCCWGSAR